MEFVFRGKTLETGARTLLCGILNITPDSFSDGGCFNSPSRAADRALEMVSEGADMVDIGAESSRPGAEPVPAQEEKQRLLPVLRKIRENIRVPVSVDTYKPETAEAALGEGADIINDITGLRDPAMIPVLRRAEAGVIIMHMRGTPLTMQDKPEYGDVVKDVLGFLGRAVEKAVSEGLPRNNIAVDPGIGFGKTTRHNLLLLNSLDVFSRLNRPVMVGISRKSVIGDILQLPVAERFEGTAALAACAVLKGAGIIRVHDVRQIHRVIRMADAVKNCAPAEKPPEG